MTKEQIVELSKSNVPLHPKLFQAWRDWWGGDGGNGGHKKNRNLRQIQNVIYMFVCIEVSWPSQPNGVMLSKVSIPNHTFTGQA